MYLIVCKEKHGYCIVWICIDLESSDSEATCLHFITGFWTPVLRTLCTASFYHSGTHKSNIFYDYLIYTKLQSFTCENYNKTCVKYESNIKWCTGEMYKITYLVVMTTTNVCCSQTILQKSPQVFGRGP